MPKTWDEANAPDAYLLTFRTFGTWHHGDARGSVDRRSRKSFGAPRMRPSEELEKVERSNQKGSSFLFDNTMREVVDAAIKEVCTHRAYDLHALNVRSNHAHAVVSFLASPEKIMEALKAYSTRALRRAKLIDPNTKIWSRHGSTRYLWRSRMVDAAIHYVLYYQGDEFPSFDEVLEELG
jgi:REP element-mobilizing transposase RayT